MNRVTRSSSGAVSPLGLKRRASAASTTLTTSSPASPTKAAKRIKRSNTAPAIATADLPSSVGVGVVGSPERDVVDEEVIKQEAEKSDVRAEAEGVLLHPALTFKYEDARNHLIALDERWRPVMDALPCKPYEGVQEEAFNPFRSLTTSILGQQVSWLAARSITHKFVRLFYPHLPEKPPPRDAPAPTEPTPFPTPAQIVALGPTTATTTLRSAGLSGRKVEYVIELATRFHDGRLDARKLWDMDDDSVAKTLLEVRGIGLWTVQMFLMFSMKRPDVLAVGDLGLQKGLCKWYSMNDPGAHLLSALKASQSVVKPESLPSEETVAPLNSQTSATTATTATELASSRGPSPPSTPKRRHTAASAYPTPSSPSFSILESVGAEPTTPTASQGATLAFEVPPTSNGLSPGTLKARLAGKKLKGNLYLSPTEMDELTRAWSPYRSVGCWWSIAGGGVEN